MTIASPTQATKPRPRARRRAWKLRVDQHRLADLLPAQGEWTADDYLWLTRSTNHLIEWADGWIEELPMPTSTHQRVLLGLTKMLDAWMVPQGGIVLFSPLRMRVSERRFREPDLLALRDATDGRYGDDHWIGADLVLEIISPGNAEHDLVTKRAEYAEARIPEYWIVDPDAEIVIVLTLDGVAYREHGRFGRGETATSPLLAGFTVAIEDIFAAP
ncbi:MAG: Uma2 family endonuclease [Ardenticatenales bacterium]|nr:Uma2 family endonuclease [Ardenticatenales bacterium]